MFHVTTVTLWSFVTITWKVFLLRLFFVLCCIFVFYFVCSVFLYSFSFSTVSLLFQYSLPTAATERKPAAVYK